MASSACWRLCRAALAIAFAGMAIMPWGTMGLATVTGAALLKLPPSALGAHSAVTSAPIFMVLALMAVWLAGYRQGRVLLETAALALFFVAALYGASRWIGAEVAGMCAGTAVMALLLVGKRVNLPRDAWPYGLIFASACPLFRGRALWRFALDRRGSGGDVRGYGGDGAAPCRQACESAA